VRNSLRIHRTFAEDGGGCCGQVFEFTGLVIYRCTSGSSYASSVTFEVTLRDRSVEVVEGADGYQQEGPMTTFFRDRSGRLVIGAWSTRLASFRTSDIVIVRRLEHDEVPARTRPLRSA
jgi:hypothetical protein